MTRSPSSIAPKLATWALVAVVALSLGACGRKSGLALPPAAAPQTAAGEPVRDQAGNPVTETQTGPSASTLFGPPGDEPAPQAAPGQKKRFFLDPLLD